MKVMVSCLLTLLFVNHAFGAVVPCEKDMSDKTACVAGELMKCNKEFDAVTHQFRYEWHGVSDTGQPFEIYLNSEYKKSPGYIPAKCSDAKIPTKSIGN